MKHVLFVCVMMSALTQLKAQSDNCNLRFSGRAVDMDHKEPLSYATLYINETQTAVVADENGKFMFEGLCPDTFTLVISHIGCTTSTFTIALTEDTFKEFRLDHTSENLESIVVHGERDKNTGTLTETTLSGKKLDRLSGKSLGEALKDVNGVSSLQTGNGISKPVIHGLHSNRILIMNNGVRQEGQQWGNEHGPEIDPFIAKSLTVIKGAASVQYGSDALGGVILVQPAPMPTQKGVSGDLHAVGFSNTRGGAASLMLQYKASDSAALSYRLQGSIKREGNVKTPNYFLANSALAEQSGAATIDYHRNNLHSQVYYSYFHNKVGIFSGSHIGNLTDLQTAFASDTPLVHQDFTYIIGRPYQDIVHHLIKNETNFHHERLGTFSLITAWQNDLRSEYDAHTSLIDSIAALGLPSLYFEIGTITADLKWEQHPGKRHNAVIGISGMNQQNITRYSIFIPNFKNYSGGIYAIENYKFGRVLLEGGIRYDYKWMQIFRYEGNTLETPTHQYGNLSGIAGMQFFDGRHTQYNLNFSSAWRSPSVSELYSDGLHHGSASLEYGNDSLVSERAYQIIAGIEHQSDKWYFDVGVYNNFIYNFIYLEPTLPAELTIRGAFPVFHYMQTNANLSGADVQTSYMIIPQIKAEIKASTLRARDVANNKWLVMMPADKISFDLEYQPADFKWMHDNAIHAGVEYVFEQKRAPLDEDYVPPPSAYTLFSAGIEGVIALHANEISWSLSADNLLNTAYRNYMNRFRYFADDMGRNITLRIKIPITGKSNL